jgi:hypothetical protein
MFEALMLVFFGAAWPISIARALRVRAVGSKSLMFVVMNAAGYIAGIVHKLQHSHDWVLWLYFANLLMVAIDAGLYVRNKRFVESSK